MHADIKAVAAGTDVEGIEKANEAPPNTKMLCPQYQTLMYTN